MKTYPHIDGGRGIQRGVPVYVFDKLDGSNIRAEWTRKRGFDKFGKRNGLLDDITPFIKEAQPLFLDKYADDLSKVFRKQRWDKATVFFEFFGPTSFAGQHFDEEHDVVIFDVAVHRQGFLEPRPFLKLFDHLHLPTLLHHGNFTHELQDQIANSELEGMTFEGVVAKGPWDKKTGRPLMFKWKSLAWIRKLKDHCGENDELFRRML